MRRHKMFEFQGKRIVENDDGDYIEVVDNKEDD